MLATNVLQALLVGCVVLWVLDVPRQVLDVSFYTEQLLAVTLGLTLALAFITETSRQPSAIDPGGLCAVVAVVAYLLYHYYAQQRDRLADGRGAGRRRRLDLHREPRRLRALVRLALRHRLAAARRLHHRPLRGADLRARHAAARGRDRQRDPDLPGAGRQPPHLRLGLRRDHPGDRGLRLHQPVPGRRFPDPLGLAGAHGRLRRPRRERHDRLDPAGRGAGRHPLHHPRPGAGAHRRRGFLLRPRHVGDVALPRRRRQDRGGRLGAVRHDLRQRGVERARGRHRHHPGDDQIRLLAVSRGRDRSRSARPAAS